TFTYSHRRDRGPISDAQRDIERGIIEGRIDARELAKGRGKGKGKAGGNSTAADRSEVRKVVSFQKAKKNLYTKVYRNSGETLYCDCKWSNRKVDLSSCGLQSFFPKKQRKRAARTEAEHIIPASWMLKKDKKIRQCAIDAKEKKESARKYCQKYDLEYKAAHNDLVNLRPAVGQVNADRSNKPFLESITRNAETYGKCPVT
ncbi:MAG: hypothetical protein GY915_07105, partial [bacterium]|nr:hypothetical protein [bacterium]